MLSQFLPQPFNTQKRAFKNSSKTSQQYLYVDFGFHLEFEIILQHEKIIVPLHFFFLKIVNTQPQLLKEFLVNDKSC